MGQVIRCFREPFSLVSQKSIRRFRGFLFSVRAQIDEWVGREHPQELNKMKTDDYSAEIPGFIYLFRRNGEIKRNNSFAQEGKN